MAGRCIGRRSFGALVAGESRAQLALAGKPVRLTEVTIDTIKLTGFFGNRVENFVFESDASFKVMEFDDIGGHDLIGTVQLAQTAGVHKVTLNDEKSEYEVSFRLGAAFE